MLAWGLAAMSYVNTVNSDGIIRVDDAIREADADPYGWREATRYNMALGEAAYMTKDYSVAITAFTDAIQAAKKVDGWYDDSANTAYFNRAQAKFAAGQYSSAIGDYTRALDKTYYFVNGSLVRRICLWKRALAQERSGALLEAADDACDPADEPPPPAAEIDKLAEHLPEDTSEPAHDELLDGRIPAPAREAY